MLNKIWNKLYALYFQFADSLLSIFVRLFWQLRGVKMGSKCMFYGSPALYRSNRSSIVIGQNCHFRSRSTSNLIGIKNPCILSTHHPESKLTIGDSCGFSGTVIGVFQEIRIGKNVRCGANTLITDSDWHPNDPRVGSPKPVIIEDGVWLGYGVSVLKGVTIGENSVIGAGSVVLTNIPKNVIAAGNPCRVIKPLVHEEG
jgi:acetyltransferase-like isoleucine patch superfamily enzyme